jgi:general secretion pathway protein I
MKLPRCQNALARQKHQGGFTLVEVLAALLIFSLSIVGLTHAGTQSAQAVSVINEKTLAGIAADNILIRARIQPLRPGTQQGEAAQLGRVFSYTLTTSETEAAEFYRLRVEIRRGEEEQLILSRDAFRGPS